MKHVLIKFVSAILLVSLAFIFVPRLALEQGWIELEPSFSLEIVSSLAFLTLALFYYLQKIQQSSPQKFIQSYMLSITVKMLLGCVLILVMIFTDRHGAITNALLFILSYFTFTALDIAFLLQLFKDKPNVR